MYVYKATDDFYDYQKGDQQKTVEMAEDVKELKKSLEQLTHTTREIDLEGCIEFIRRYESIRDALVVEKPGQSRKVK